MIVGEVGTQQFLAQCRKNKSHGNLTIAHTPAECFSRACYGQPVFSLLSVRVSGTGRKGNSYAIIHADRRLYCAFRKFLLTERDFTMTSEDLPEMKIEGKVPPILGASLPVLAFCVLGGCGDASNGGGTHPDTYSGRLISVATRELPADVYTSRSSATHAALLEKGATNGDTTHSLRAPELLPVEHRVKIGDR